MLSFPTDISYIRDMDIKKKKKKNELVELIKQLFIFGLVLIMWWVIATPLSVILAIPIYLFLNKVYNYRGFWKIWITLNLIVSLFFMIIYFNQDMENISGYDNNEINCGYAITFLNKIGIETDCWWNYSEMSQEIKYGQIYVIGYDDKYLSQKYLNYGEEGDMILFANTVSNWEEVKSVIFKNDYGDKSKELTRPLILKIENFYLGWAFLFSIGFYTALFFYYMIKQYS